MNRISLKHVVRHLLDGGCIEAVYNTGVEIRTSTIKGDKVIFMSYEKDKVVIKSFDTLGTDYTIYKSGSFAVFDSHYVLEELKYE